MGLGSFDRTKALATIKDLNQLIFFAGVVIVVLLWLVASTGSMFRSSYVQTGVQVMPLDEAQEEPPPKVTYSKSFQRKIKDTYVFSITSHTSESKTTHSSGRAFELRKGRGYSHAPTVNFIFTTPKQKSHRLFKSDSMIDHFEFANFNENRGSLLSGNIYRVATKDTNSDGLINYEDSQNLYVSTYDGLELKLIMKEILSFQVIGDNTLLLSQSTPKGVVFYEYRVDTRTVTALDTAI